MMARVQHYICSCHKDQKHRYFSYCHTCIHIYMYKNTSLHSFVLLMTIEPRYFSCTGCNDVNICIITVSVSPMCLWVGDKLGWKAKPVLASDWPFSMAICSCVVEFLPPHFVYMVAKRETRLP